MHVIKIPFKLSSRPALKPKLNHNQIVLNYHKRQHYPQTIFDNQFKTKSKYQSEQESKMPTLHGISLKQNIWNEVGEEDERIINYMINETNDTC